MPLTECPDCGGKVSTEAAACPHCGHPQTPSSGAAPAKGLSPTAIGCLAFLGFSLLFILVSVLPDGGSREDDPRLAKAEEWLRSYYREFELGGGWKVTRIQVERGDLAVYVHVPTQQANRLMNASFDRQRRALSVACPSNMERVWDMLPPGADVELRATVGFSYDVFNDVSCRSVVR